MAKPATLDAKVPGATSAAYRYGQTVEVEGRQYPLYTDIIVFTRGRLRVWIEVSSAFEPFDPARRDLMISRLLDRVNEGANLAIIEAKSPGELLFRERGAGLWLASPIQIYLDLLCGEGRSKEMAEHFRKERIGF